MWHKLDNYRESDVCQTLIHRKPIAVQHQPGPGQDRCGVVRHSHQSYHLSTGGKPESESVVQQSMQTHHTMVHWVKIEKAHVSVNCN